MKAIVFILLIGYAYAGEEKKAIVVLKNDATGIDGSVTFTQTSEGVKVEGKITGVPSGLHGFHIHEKGDLSKGCASALGHFNPYKKNHGDRTADVRHVGDLGNVEADASKTVNINFVDKLISLDGETNILGRAVVLHELKDDLGKGGNDTSLTTGNAGGRIACGVIGILDETNGVAYTASNLSILSTIVLLSTIYNLFRT